ncbi:uncharacterized protein A4U43_UnF5630 [Asparagus officinalis]|uniref:Uncharacterized protein n=1 Tax=Asparagus officinalis TaxID=4686 RepID=A0A1R3L6N7_ASPOF|nr:uncharacterized protein A4U43_UnF5630 [Asparagus officinalis]
MAAAKRIGVPRPSLSLLPSLRRPLASSACFPLPPPTSLQRLIADDQRQNLPLAACNPLKPLHPPPLHLRDLSPPPFISLQSGFSDPALADDYSLFFANCVPSECRGSMSVRTVLSSAQAIPPPPPSTDGSRDYLPDRPRRCRWATHMLLFSLIYVQF